MYGEEPEVKKESLSWWDWCRILFAAFIFGTQIYLAYQRGYSDGLRKALAIVMQRATVEHSGDPLK